VIPSDLTLNTTRRRFLKLATRTLATGVLAPLGACSSSQPGRAQGKKAALRLDWVVVGKHAPYFLGKERGYYESEGILLDIQGGKGSGNTAQLVAAGSHPFGYLDAGILIRSIQEGAPLKSIMVIKQKTPFCIVSLAKSGIRSPQDLEGKSLAATTGVNDPILSLLPALMQMNDADFSKVQVIQVASQAKEGLVLTERVDAMTGSITAQPPAFEAQGHDIEVLSFSDWGVNPISNVLVTHNTLLQEDPQLVRSFLKATARSIEASLENPGDALTALKKAYPETDTQVARLQLQWFFKLIQSEQAQAVFGYHDRGAWEELQALQIQYLGLRERWDVSQYFTNDFLPG
jgi:NitT/TauT family transport system substrate-binding protein